MEPETEAERRARIIAEVEASLAEGLPVPPDAGWQYPPASRLPDALLPEPPFFRGALALLNWVAVVHVVIALALVALGN
jgi:hypothetical protein